MAVWYMNLKDNRIDNSRNNDEELKFRICMEKSVLAIGWGINADFDSWRDYRELADLYYKGSTKYKTAVNALSKMSCGDLVWIRNPVAHSRYLAQVLDDEPSLCCNLREFDLFSYRKADIYGVDEGQMGQYGLLKEKPTGRHAIERIGKQELINATERLFESIIQSRS